MDNNESQIVELGNGNVSIGHINIVSKGMAGVCFTPCAPSLIGDSIEWDKGKTLREAGTFLTITSTTTESLDVLIQSCERAKQCLQEQKDNG